MSAHKSRKPSVFDRLGNYDVQPSRSSKKISSSANNKDKLGYSKSEARKGHSHQTLPLDNNYMYNDVKKGYKDTFGEKHSKVREESLKGSNQRDRPKSPRDKHGKHNKRIMDGDRLPRKRPHGNDQRQRPSRAPRETVTPSKTASLQHVEGRHSREKDRSLSPVEAESKRACITSEHDDISEGDLEEPAHLPVVDFGDDFDNESMETVQEVRPQEVVKQETIPVQEVDISDPFRDEREKLLEPIQGQVQNRLKISNVLTHLGCSERLAGPTLYKRTIALLQEHHHIDLEPTPNKYALEITQKFKMKKRLETLASIIPGAFTTGDDIRLRKKLAGLADKSSNQAVTLNSSLSKFRRTTKVVQETMTDSDIGRTRTERVGHK